MEDGNGLKNMKHETLKVGKRDKIQSISTIRTKRIYEEKYVLYERKFIGGHVN